MAGPTKVGKSTFKNRLVSDSAFRLSLGLPAEVTAQTDANEIRRLPIGTLDHVILHYDFFRPYDRPLGTYERDPAMELLRNAEHVSLFTMMTPRARIRSQLAAEKLKRSKQQAKPPRRDTLYKLYDSPDFLADWYARWFRFCAKTGPMRHTVVRNNGDYNSLTMSNGKGFMRKIMTAATTSSPSRDAVSLSDIVDKKKVAIFLAQDSGLAEAIRRAGALDVATYGDVPASGLP